MAKPLLLILTLTALVVAASAASVTIYNPATLPVSVVILQSAGDHPRDGADYEGDVVDVSTAITTVNLTEPEQDIQIKSTGEGTEVEVHVVGGDVLVVIPGVGGLDFNIDILVHKPASPSVHVVPPGPK